MKKCVLLLTVVAVTCAMLLVVGNPSAEAFPPFKAQFDKKYMTDGSEISKVLEGKTNCNLCHLGTKDKKKRNAYGEALDKLLSKDDTTKPEKIVDALSKVEAEKSGDTTFGALIKSGKLPITKDE
jgi:hypothetical protein